MTKEERDALVKQMVHEENTTPQVEKQHDDEYIEKSIAEAVVAARTEEAKRQESKWEREKEALLAQAEQAAIERVEADLKIQQQRAEAMAKWQADLAQETNAEQVQEEHHPVLGEVVADFGFKRLHVVSAKTLASIPVWKKQRIYRHDRAKAMAADKAKSSHFGLPGVIALHEVCTHTIVLLLSESFRPRQRLTPSPTSFIQCKEGKLTILDGQHRVGMMTILEEKKDEISFDLDRVLVEVFPEIDEKQYDSYAQDIFTEINKAEPVKLVDMPGVASKTDRKVITEGAARLKEAYPDMFKPSQRCRAPHLNVDNLRDALFASDIIKRHKLKSPKALQDWMMQQNEELKALYEQEEHASKVSKAALTKAHKFNFYLGLDSSWLYN